LQIHRKRNHEASTDHLHSFGNSSVVDHFDNVPPGGRGLEAVREAHSDHQDGAQAR
jgi:hypothetical protein